MRISLIFPLLFVVINALRLMSGLMVAAGLSLLSQVLDKPKLHDDVATFQYLAVFAVGIILAKNLDGISRRYRGVALWWRALFGIAALSLYCEGHFLGRIRGAWRIEEAVLVAGGCGIIVVCLNSDVPRRFLHSPLPSFLGRISYSLYLVHGTVLFFLAMEVHGSQRPGMFLA